MFEGLEGVILISSEKKIQDYQKSLELAGLRTFQVIQIVIKDGEGINLRGTEKAKCLVFDDSIIDLTTSRSEVAKFLEEVRKIHKKKKIIFFSHWDDTDPKGHAESIILGRGEDSISEKCEALAETVDSISRKTKRTKINAKFWLGKLKDFFY